MESPYWKFLCSLFRGLGTARRLSESMSQAATRVGGYLDPLYPCYLHVAYRITKKMTVFVVCEDYLLSINFRSQFGCSRLVLGSVSLTFKVLAT